MKASTSTNPESLSLNPPRLAKEESLTEALQLCKNKAGTAVRAQSFLTNIGALIIRMGLGGILHYKYNLIRNPSDPILIVKAPTLCQNHWVALLSSSTILSRTVCGPHSYSCDKDV